MRPENFRLWLLAARPNLNTAARANALSRALRVGQYQGDLDLIPANGRGEFHAILDYGAADENAGAPNPTEIPINGNLRNGLASLKSAVSLYFEFLNEWEDPDVIPEIVRNAQIDWEEELPEARETAHRANVRGRQDVNGFPLWSRFDEDREAVLNTLSARVLRRVRFLAPMCIEALVRKNDQADFKTGILEKLEALQHTGTIVLDTYLWDNCPVAFPGIRRYVGAGEKRGQTDRPNSVKLDDNYYPKQIWAFVLTGSYFRNVGPFGFQLDHLLEHKKGLAMHDFLVPNDPQNRLIYSGLFTSAANTIYTDRAFSSFTDHSPLAIEVLFRIVHRLYNGVCAVLPQGWSLQDAPQDVEQVVDAFFGDERHLDLLVGNPNQVETFAEWRQIKYQGLFAAL